MIFFSVIDMAQQPNQCDQQQQPPGAYPPPQPQAVYPPPQQQPGQQPPPYPGAAPPTGTKVLSVNCLRDMLLNLFDATSDKIVHYVLLAN